MVDIVDPPAEPNGGTAGEAFRALYRRYRPQRFEEVRGQDHASLALRNAVRDGRVAHAYLFSGPRGTGKTSTARILAKALNCTALEDGEPCGICDSCMAVARGASFDVQELDAASNNGVDAMRDLVARASLATPGRWKVYIVDEVHMLSTQASNALLKTLEEPPGHVVFVLATTDPQKVLPTIRSRTQHFEFHLLSDGTLADLLGDVAADAHLDLPPDAISVATRRGRGSARDALSALDQVAAAGASHDEIPVLDELVAALAERDTARALGAVATGIAMGRPPERLAVDLVEHLRGGFLALAAPSTAGPGALAGKASFRDLGLARCVRAMETIGTAQVAMREAVEPRVVLELALVRCTHPEADDSPAALLERIERIEHRLGEMHAAPAYVSPPPPPAPAVNPPSADSAASPMERPTLGAYRQATTIDRPAVPDPAAAPAAPATASASVPQPATAPTAGGEPPLPAAAPRSGGLPPTRDELVAAWGDHILVGLPARQRAVFQAGRFVGTRGDNALFAVPNKAHLMHAEPLRSEVAAAISSHFGRRVNLEVLVDPGQGSAAGPDERDFGHAAGEFEMPPPEDASDPGPARPPVQVGGLALAEDRLMSAFPGIEED